MNIYDLLNIMGNSKEEAIIEAIATTKEELTSLTKESTCLIYSSYLTRNLLKKHIVNRLINTKDLNYPYEHQFNLIPLDEKNAYLVDLCFSQFHSKEFPSLELDGYIIVDDARLSTYLEIVGQDNKKVSLSKLLNEGENIKKR